MEVSLSAVSACAILLFACATLSATGASSNARAASAWDAPLAPVSPSAAPNVNATDVSSSPPPPDAPLRNTARQTSCGACTIDRQSTHGSARGPRPRRATTSASSPIRSARPPENVSDVLCPGDSIPGRNGHVAAHPSIAGGSPRFPGARYSTSTNRTTRTSWGTSGTIASLLRTMQLGEPSGSTAKSDASTDSPTKTLPLCAVIRTVTHLAAAIAAADAVGFATRESTAGGLAPAPWSATARSGDAATTSIIRFGRFTLIPDSDTALVGASSGDVSVVVTATTSLVSSPSASNRSTPGTTSP
mmetsp:Transcript_3867/g.17037  ORF Transcript_3867/g.17037 Transcript_3867/m.17037 type:complete len:303 (-) Transcript_3867:1403-2311(-)